MPQSSETLEPPDGTSPDERILLVDDEPKILSALQRNLGNRFHLVLAAGAEEGLRAITGSGPYAVVVSDFKMPGMDGVEFLSRVKAVSPETIRIMLTGQASLDNAVAAVNQANIFRLLSKPCPPIVLSRAIDAALAQHRLA